jgi:hypothetical protein
VSDPELLREWIESVNGRATNNPSVGEPQPAAPLTAQHRLEAPSYYAANAQVLVHGESAMLLFTRTQPVMLSNGNIAPRPLGDTVAIIQMNVPGLADLSKATADVIWQIEQQSRQTEVNSTRLVNSIPRAVLCNAPNGDVLPADRCEQVASGATTPPKRRARLREWLTGLKGLFRRS